MNITYKQIMSFDPCYDPKTVGMPEDYEASLKDFIIEYRDKVKDLSNIKWILLRQEFFNKRDLRLFGVWSARHVQHLMKDERSIKALDIAEKYAYGLVTEEELEAANAEAAEAATPDDAIVVYADAYAAYAAAYADAAFAATAASAAAVDATRKEALNEQLDKILEMIEKPNGQWFIRNET